VTLKLGNKEFTNVHQALFAPTPLLRSPYARGTVLPGQTYANVSRSLFALKQSSFSALSHNLTIESKRLSPARKRCQAAIVVREKLV